MKNYNSKRYNPGEYFSMPKVISRLDLNACEIAVLAFLMYCEDRETFKCHPSYSTIGEAVGMSNNTVKKYVESLEKKGFISTEPTLVKTRDGHTHNGSLLYTLRPLAPIEEEYFEKKMRESQAQSNFRNALKKYEKKGAKAK